jgi:hypothetical protein
VLFTLFFSFSFLIPISRIICNRGKYYLLYKIK